MNSVKTTMLISLIIQLILFLVGLYGLFFKYKKKNLVLKEILVMDSLVQIVEAAMYFWIFMSISNFKVMIKRRYIDWTITTPIMLLSTILYMNYNTKKEGEIINTKTFIKNNKKQIIYIVILNFIMLLFGYLGESNIINKNLAICIGFIPFFINFKIIYEFTKGNRQNIILFYFLLIIWSMYGVSAFFNDEIKNIGYNFLDIISKNFYGLFIFIIIMIKHRNNTL